MSKKGTPLKSGYLTTVGLSSVEMIADRRRHAAYRITSTGEELSKNVNIDDLE